MSAAEPIEAAAGGRRAFRHRHTVGFEDTNLMGNVYYARLVSWQGRCRELFLRAHAPGVLQALQHGLKLATVRVACDFYEELLAFDEVDILMRLAHVRGHRIGLSFDYVVERRGQMITAAAGAQEIACLQDGPSGGAPVAPPALLLAALQPFGPDAA